MDILIETTGIYYMTNKDQSGYLFIRGEKKIRNSISQMG